MNKKLSKSEWIEIEALQAVHDSASASLREKLGLIIHNIDGIICSASSVDSSILINRCFGFGEIEPSDETVLRHVRAFYAERGIEEFFLHVTFNEESENSDSLKAAKAVKVLLNGGMTKSRGWMKFMRDNAAATARNSELTVHKIDSADADHFGEIVAPCFDMLSDSVPLLAAIVEHPNWHVYMGFDNGTPAATGALFLKGGVGYYDWAATHADYRRRGFQGAVLSHLINDAIAMGCQELVTATGEEIPGDPQHSYNNILRYGFAEHYLRQNWVPVSV